MLAREKSQRGERSQKRVREREKKRQVWPEKAQNKARDIEGSSP